MQHFKHSEIQPVLRSLHHLGPLPLPELVGLYRERVISHVRRHRLIEPYQDEAGGVLYVVTGKGKDELGLSRSRKLSPQLATAGFMRQVAHTYLVSQGLFYDRPESTERSNTTVREYWNRNELQPERYRVIAALPNPPGATIRRLGYRGAHAHTFWLFADSARHYDFLYRDVWFDPEYLKVTLWPEVRPVLSEPMLKAFDRLCKARLGRVFE